MDDIATTGNGRRTAPTVPVGRPRRHPVLDSQEPFEKPFAEFLALGTLNSSRRCSAATRMLQRNWDWRGDLMSRVRELLRYEVVTREGAQRGLPSLMCRDECKALIIFIDRVGDLANYLLNSRTQRDRDCGLDMRQRAIDLNFDAWRTYLKRTELPLYTDEYGNRMLRLRGGVPGRYALCYDGGISY